MPKEYIDRENLLLDLSETLIFSGREGETFAELRGAKKVISRIENAPTADVVEVVHGEWIEHEGYEECNKCHSKSIYHHNWCPNCGAKMGGERRE